VPFVFSQNDFDNAHAVLYRRVTFGGVCVVQCCFEFKGMSKAAEAKAERAGMHAANAAANPELKTAACIIPDLLYFISFASTEPAKRTATSHFFSIDSILLYEPFFGDFGPLNLGCLYRFCETLNAKLKTARERNKVVYYYCGSRLQFRSNAAVLIGGWQVLYNNKSPEEAYEPLKVYEPYMPFRDAAVGLSTFHLTPFHCINAIMYARDRNLFDFHKTFNIEEYEYFECVENGDLSVLVHDKFIAFAGPHATRRSPDGYPTFTPEDYVPIFKKYNVTHVVRLNRKLYNKQRFTEGGFGHTDLYFVDGTCPSMQILNQFLDLCATDKYLAVHCKAGLGRTGTLIGSFIMQEWEIPAAETIGWLRICRPGSVIGPQQHFLIQHESEMFRRGRALRSGGPPVPMGSAPAPAPSRTAPSPQPYERKKTSPTTSASPTPAKQTPAKAIARSPSGKAAVNPPSPAARAPPSSTTGTARTTSSSSASVTPKSSLGSRTGKTYVSLHAGSTH